MKHHLKMALSSVLLGAAALFTAPAQAQDFDTMTAEELLPHALEEGKVTILSLSSRIAQIKTSFEEKYPGIEVEAVHLNSTRQIARLQAEQRAGIYAVDVLYMSETPVVYRDLLPEGMVEAFIPARVKADVPEALRENLLTHRLSTRALMYNEAAHPDGSPIENLWQLTTPEWRGRVLIDDPTQRGETLDLLVEIALNADAMAEAYEALFGEAIEVDRDLEGAGEQFIRDLFNNDVVMINDTQTLRSAIGLISEGAKPVGFMTYSASRNNERDGMALQISNDTVPAAGILFPTVLALGKNAPNPAAARLMIDYLMGDDSPTGGTGFEPFAVQGDYAARRTIVDHPDAIPFDDLNLWLIDPERTGQARQRILDLVIVLQ
ncbi:ABC transporter substrate-binding protein [Natronohydrobacter thiooxidans]|uniref:ABC transporter substrate-binding protein n=1 Tax=Natronohydrobacter thiooxidans TaxID=87172 RepID=UPI0008FF085E|nr:substrate-binding domain-containing protein [Natronohydrobacter thiooxidans]